MVPRGKPKNYLNCVQNLVVTFGFMVWFSFSGSVNLTVLLTFTPVRPLLTWQQNLSQNRYNSVYIRDISEILASNRGFRDRATNGVSNATKNIK